MELAFTGELWFWKGPAPWPKDGQYVVPIKTWVRRAEGLELGDEVTVRLAVDL